MIELDLETGCRENTDYAYAVGRTRALEASRLRREHFDRLLEANDFETAARLLGEMGYERFFAGPGRSLDDVRRAVNAALGEALGEVHDLSLDPGVSDAFLCRTDLLRAKALIRQHHLTTAYELPPLARGSVDPEALGRAVEQSDVRSLPAWLGPHLDRAIALAEEHRTALPVDAYLDVAAFAIQTEAARRSGSGLLQRVARAASDLFVLDALLRAPRLARSRGEMLSALPPYGRLSVVEALSAFDRGDVVFERALHSPYGPMLHQALERPEPEQADTFQRLARQYRFDLWDEAKFVAFGLEPLIAYADRVEAEVQNVWLILVGQAHGLAPDELHHRLVDY